jgi:hypothetical protein
MSMLRPLNGGVGCYLESIDTCTAAKAQPFEMCVKMKCAAEVTALKTDCGTTLTCFDACACDDEACTDLCDEPAAACGDAESAYNDCAYSKCELGNDCGGSMKTCAELTACCNTIMDAMDKKDCQDFAATNNPVVCANYHNDFCPPAP